MGSGKQLNPWNRKGLFYVANIRVFNGKTHKLIGTVHKKMFFVTYHLIRKIWGEEELTRIAYKVRENL